MRTMHDFLRLLSAFVVFLLPSCGAPTVAQKNIAAPQSATAEMLDNEKTAISVVGDAADTDSPGADTLGEETLDKESLEDAPEMESEGDEPADDEVEADPKAPRLVIDSGGHIARISQLFFHPDGRRLISVSLDETIRIWDLETGESRVLRLSKIGMLKAAALSADGGTLAVGCKDTVFLIDINTETIRRSIPAYKRVRTLKLSLDGTLLAATLDGGLPRLWNVADGSVRHLLQGRNGQIAISPDGKSVVFAEGGDTNLLRAYSTKSGKKTHEKPINDADNPSQAVWFPDRNSVLIGTQGCKLYTWNLDDDSLRSFELDVKQDRDFSQIVSLQFVDAAQTGKPLFVAYGNKFRHEGAALFCGLRRGSESRLFAKNDPGVSSAVVSPDGKLAAVASTRNTRIELIDTMSRQVVRHLGGAGKVVGAQWGKDGQSLFLERPRQEIVIDLSVPATLDARDFSPAQVDNHALGNVRLVQKDHRLNILVNGKKTGQLNKENLEHNARKELDIRRFAVLSPDRALVLTVQGEHFIDLHQAKKIRGFGFHAGAVGTVGRDPSNRYFLTTCEDQRVRIFDAKSCQPLLFLYSKGDNWVAWTNEGYYAASPEGEQLIGWRVGRGKDEFAEVFAVDQFRRRLYRPDVIRRVLETGSVAEALKQANAERGGTNDADAAPTTIAAILPPIVRFLEPAQPRIKVRESTLTVRAVAQGRHAAQPVTRMQLLIEGRPAADVRAATPGSEPGQMVMSWPVALVPGKQRLQVLAEGVSQGRSEELEIEYEPEVKGKDFFKPRLYVLAIGINAYANPGLRLRCAVNDATELQATFEKNSLGTVFREVHVKRLVDGEANREGFLGGLQWLAEQPLTRQDVVVMFFAGHGDMDEQKQFYLLPQDVQPKQLGTTAVPGTLLQKTLVQLQSKVLLMLDACHSGRIDALGELRRELSSYEAGVVVMCAADESTQAGEKEGHGYFAKALIEGLSGQATRHRIDRSIYLNSLDAYVDERVRELSLDRQKPVTAKPGSIHSFPLSQPAEANAPARAQ